MEPSAAAALTTVRAYHNAWWSQELDAAAGYLADTLVLDVPINSYTGKADFLEAVRKPRGMAARLEMLAELGDERDAVLIYDMTLPIGDLRVAELFHVDDGRITRIRHIHDTAALRLAGFGSEVEQ